MNRDETAAELRRRGYPPQLAAFAIAMATSSVKHDLARHQVTRLPDGEYQITPRPWEGDGTDGLKPPASGRFPSLDEVLESIGKVDAWLDGDVAGTYREQPLAQDWARTAKVAEETGEAQEELDAWRQAALDQARVSEIDIPAGRAIAALIAVTGQNPRKGVHGTREALLKELADVVCTGLFAIQHFTKDADVTWTVFLDALNKARSRVPGESPFPPEPVMTRGAS